MTARHVQSKWTRTYAERIIEHEARRMVLDILPRATKIRTAIVLL
jgi:hypothetical protein